jgi:hypothetical protein
MPASTPAETGVVGPTVSFEAGVPVNVATLPAGSVVTTVSATAPSVTGLELMPVATATPPPAVWLTGPLTNVPFVRRTTADSLPGALAGQVTETETAATLARLMTFTPLLAPASTFAAVAAIGATVSLSAVVPVIVDVFWARSVSVTETVMGPSAIEPPLIAGIETVPPPFGEAIGLELIVTDESLIVNV